MEIVKLSRDATGEGVWLRSRCIHLWEANGIYNIPSWHDLYTRQHKLVGRDRVYQVPHHSFRLHIHLHLCMPLPFRGKPVLSDRIYNISSWHGLCVWQHKLFCDDRAYQLCHHSFRLLIYLLMWRHPFPSQIQHVIVAWPVHKATKGLLMVTRLYQVCHSANFTLADNRRCRLLLANSCNDGAIHYRIQDFQLRCCCDADAEVHVQYTMREGMRERECTPSPTLLSRDAH